MTKEMKQKVESLRKEAKKNKEISDITKHEMVQDSVLVLPIDFDEDDTVINPRQYEDKPYWGLVLAKGKGRLLENGTREPCPVEEGDIILFGAYASTTVRSMGQDFLYLKDEDIVSKYVG